MRLLAFVVVLSGCDFMEVFAGPQFPPCEPGPWTEQTLAQTRAATFVAATRAGCGFPDAETDYRILRVGKPWVVLAEGSLETYDWNRAIEHTPEGVVLHLVTEDCRFNEAELTCTSLPRQ